MAVNNDDLGHLRRAIAVALIAREAGHRPFGALVVEGGEVIAEAGSTQGSQGDTTAHAEMNAVRLAAKRATRERLGRATIYASSEPCAMCAAAIFYNGISRIVFGFPEARLRALRNQTAQGSGVGLSCRTLLARAPRTVVIEGPLLDNEAAAPHEGAWPAGQALSTQPSRPAPKRDDDAKLRRAIALAGQAGAAGELPFGAVIAAADGSILVEATSTEIGESDWTCHAETNAVRHATRNLPREAMEDATIYASSEPCAMCATAIFYSGLRRVVYGFPEPRLRALLGFSAETSGLGFSCREVLAEAAETVEIVGPNLENEAAAVHDGYWSRRGVGEPR